MHQSYLLKWIKSGKFASRSIRPVSIQVLSVWKCWLNYGKSEYLEGKIKTATLVKTWYLHSDKCPVCESNLELKWGRPSKFKTAKVDEGEYHTLQEQESGTGSTSEGQDQIRFTEVYSLSMDCLGECIQRIPEKDQHALLIELWSSFSNQLMVN